VIPDITQFISTTANVGPDTAHGIVRTVVAVLVIWAVRRVVLFIVFRRVEDARRRYAWRKTTGYLGAAIGAVTLAVIWIEDVGSVATFVGLVAAGVAIALRDIVVNLAGWLYIVARRPLVVGDRIQIGTYAGDVIDIRLFAFTILEIRNWVEADQSTGRVVHIPNGQLLREPLANYNQGFSHIWNEIPVLLTFESNWRRGKELLEEIAREHAESLSQTAEQKLREASKRFMIYYTKLTPAVYTTVSQSGVLLTIRYLTQPQRRRVTEAEMWEDILTRFAESPDIEFAYPTTRFFDHVRETMSPDLPGSPVAAGPERDK
jgi:small-conductance mechanosensitive channel